jgi:hypothetical protein
MEGYYTRDLIPILCNTHLKVKKSGIMIGTGLEIDTSVSAAHIMVYCMVEQQKNSEPRGACELARYVLQNGPHG